MTNLEFNLSNRAGKIKRMNAVNNGPTNPGVRNVKTNFEAYKSLNIPYARNHDASFYTPYGGEHIVDVHRIFKDFSADENDPASYIFEPTDKYLANTLNAGTKIFYRLGAAIEHRYKYGTRVPADFAKWARICEHIIRHYNEGWANGFEYGIEYWEIWNEPDCCNPDGTNPCWQGTDDEFIELYLVASKHLKKCFPNLKIGGPAFCDPQATEFKLKFLDAVREKGGVLDFFSYHWYGSAIAGKAPEGWPAFEETVKYAREFLDAKGFAGVETILNEWNYIKGWLGDDWRYSTENEKNLKGSAFVLGTMITAQNSPVDMLMYYDARPCGMNGLFELETYKCQKPYYSFEIFRRLAQLGTQVPTEYYNDEIYSIAATDGESYAAAITYFDDDDNCEAREVKATFVGLSGRKRVSCFVLDNERDLILTRDEIFTADEFSLYLNMSPYSSVLVKIEKV